MSNISWKLPQDSDSGFTLGDKVRVIAADHPHCGEVGIIIGFNDIYFPSGTIRYWFVDIGIDTISVTADQITNRVFRDVIRPPRTDSEWYVMVWGRDLDRELASTTGYDYEQCDLAHVTFESDGAE